MSREQILARVDSLKSTPIAFEAIWDGDSTGWFVRLVAITADSESHPLGTLSDGGDMRLFTGQVPPWPEAAAAKHLGNELAERFGAEFYFSSPDHPDEDCPSWRDRMKGLPCRRCGALLLQRRGCRWRGVCYHCHLAEEREQREAHWTAEQRAGPRCFVCGKPATNTLNGNPACADCFNKYEVYTCGKCHAMTLILKSVVHTSLCSRCELHNAIESLTDNQRNTIRKAMANGRLEAIQSAMSVLGCSLHNAQHVLHVLKDANSTEKLA